jgi:hypothetical protein
MPLTVRSGSLLLRGGGLGLGQTCCCPCEIDYRQVTKVTAVISGGTDAIAHFERTSSVEQTKVSFASYNSHLNGTYVFDDFTTLSNGDVFSQVPAPPVKGCVSSAFLSNFATFSSNGIEASIDFPGAITIRWFDRVVQDGPFSDSIFTTDEYRYYGLDEIDCEQIDNNRFLPDFTINPNYRPGNDCGTSAFRQSGCVRIFNSDARTPGLLNLVPPAREYPQSTTFGCLVDQTGTLEFAEGWASAETSLEPGTVAPDPGGGSSFFGFRTRLVLESLEFEF